MLLGRTDTELGLDMGAAPAVEGAKEAPVGLKVPLHETLVIHHDVHALAEEDRTVEREACYDCGLPLPRAHLCNERPHVRIRGPRDVLQTDEHADHLCVVRQHQDVELLLHDLRPGVEDRPQAPHRDAGIGRRDPKLLQDAKHVLLAAQVQPGSPHELPAWSVLQLALADVLHDPGLALEAAVHGVGQSEVLPLQKPEEEEDCVERREDLLELRDIMAIDNHLCAREEELVVGRLWQVHKADALAEVREVEVPECLPEADAVDDFSLHPVHAGSLADEVVD
mmetsp:Transcript_95425/g.279028  ORF Transcript_95425/g.279028 Transcript_95425/m.279028 type:complete len:281 (+) Transcript_95425:2349-3191(+)